MSNSFKSEPIPVNTEDLTPAEIDQLVALYSTDECRPKKGECGLCVGPDSSGELIVRCAGFQPPDVEVPLQDDEGEVFGRWLSQPPQACEHPDKLRQVAESIEASLRAKNRT